MWIFFACTAATLIPTQDESGAETGLQPIEEAPGGDTATSTDETDAVFDPLRVASFSLEMAPESWADMTGNPYAETWHEATFHAEGAVVEGVGVRTFGAGSLIYNKPSIKISFDHFVPGQDWRGLEQLKLDNSSQDAGFMNEAIGTAILRRANLPAARTGYARLAVNDAPAGFFVVLEPIDDVFLNRWFGDDSGNLYGTADSRYAQGLNPIPIDGPLDWFVPQTNAETDGSDLLAIIDTVANGSDEALSAALDIDEFTEMSVIRSVFGGIDTMSADGNNYYLYQVGGYWSIIAWDLDADLGYPYYYQNALAVDPRAPWATSPWAWNPVTGTPYTDPVLSRALAMGADTDALVANTLAGPGDWATIDAEIQAIVELIRDDVYNDVLGYGPSFDLRQVDLRLFVHTRIARLLGRDPAPCEEAPEGGTWIGALGPTGTVGWGNLLVDQTNWGPGMTVAGDHFCRGVFAHAPSDVTVVLPAGTTELSGWFGLQDWVQKCGDGATGSIVQGGRTLWTSPSRGTYDEAVATGTVAVEAGTIQLVTSPNAEYSCDTAVWADVMVR